MCVMLIINKKYHISIDILFNDNEVLRGSVRRKTRHTKNGSFSCVVMRKRKKEENQKIEI